MERKQKCVSQELNHLENAVFMLPENHETKLAGGDKTNRTQFIVLLVAVVIIVTVTALIAYNEGFRTGITNLIDSFAAGTSSAIGGFMDGLYANPIYKTYHSLIYFSIGCIVTFVLYKLWAAGKIPIRQPASKAPTSGPEIKREPQSWVSESEPVPNVPVKKEPSTAPVAPQEET